MNSRKKGFTLIELIAVLVILAIIALIVTPLVMNIIRKAKISADRRSVDAYGRSVELAIAGYLLDTGTFPTSMNQLTVEYKGDEVVCTTTQIKSTYYVIEDSDTTNDTVKLLKETPLTKTEMDNLNLTGITITESNSYGQVQYGSTNDYSTSTVKQVVDAWKNTAVASGDTATARLISHDDLVDNLGYENRVDTINPSSNGTTPTWVYNSNYWYWTMSQYGDSSDVWHVINDGRLNDYGVSGSNMVRPVLVLSKSADITKVS